MQTIINFVHNFEKRCSPDESFYERGHVSRVRLNEKFQNRLNQDTALREIIQKTQYIIRSKSY